MGREPKRKMDEYKYFQVEQHEGAPVLVLIDPSKLNFMMMTGLRDELTGFFLENSPKRLVIDFTQVASCSSVTIASLIDARNHICEGGGNITLCGMSEDVRAVFRVTNLDTLFTICDTVADALKAF